MNLPTLFSWREDPATLFDDILNDIKNSTSHMRISDVSFPKFNYYADKLGNLLIEATVAGWSKEDIDVTIKDGCLVISAESQQQKDNEWKCIQKEIKQSSFSTRVRLPYPEKFDIDKAEASVKDGLLSISIPKKKEILELEEGRKLLIK